MGIVPFIAWYNYRALKTGEQQSAQAIEHSQALSQFCTNQCLTR
jgi:hypothetical protein